MKKLLAIVGVIGTALAANTAAASTNLVTNGDFEGAGSFITDYSFRDGSSNTDADRAHSLWDEGTWTINTDPHNVHALWIDQDLGKALILNGKTTSPIPSVAWAQDLGTFATAGTYNFAFDLYNIYHGPGASSITFATSVNGGAYSNPVTIVTSPPDDAGYLYHQTGSFTVGPGALRVAFFSNSDVAGGNDFALDNISVAAVPEPATWLMMIMGFGGLGAMLRRTRRAAALAA